MPNYPKFTNKIIKYKEAPSGKVRIGKYIPPFEPVKNGHGYFGVVLEDVETGKLQCHICGKWFEVFNSHLLKAHEINSNTYRFMFGLSRGTALKSKRVRLIQSKLMVEMRKKNKKYNQKFSKGNNYAGNRKGKSKSQETVNKYGVCDLQITDRILKLKRKLGKTPSLIDLQKEYGNSFCFHIYKRYSSYIELCKNLGMEACVSSYNPKYSREYFIEKALSNEPSLRIYTLSESRNLYKYFKGGISELKQEIINKKLSK